MTTNITNNAGYLIKLLSPNQINTFNDFLLEFNIYANSFNNNDILTVTLHSDNYVTGRSYVVTDNLKYDSNQINYKLSSNNQIFTNLSTRVDGEYYLIISSVDKIYTSDPNKYVYITSNQDNNVIFNINKDSLSYNVTKNTNLLLNFTASGFYLGSTFNIKIGDIYQSPQIPVTKSSSYELILTIPNNAINKNYNAVLTHDSGHIMDIVSDIKVNTFTPNTNILPCTGFNSIPFNQNPSTISLINTSKTIPLPPEVIGLNLNIIHNNTSYNGNINVKNFNKNSLIVNSDSNNTKFNINNHRIFDNQLLYNAFTNQEITQVNQPNQISITYIYHDSYLINLNNVKTYHIKNDKVIIDKQLDVYTGNNSDGLNLKLYGTFPIVNNSNEKYLSLNTNTFNLTGELHFYVKNSQEILNYMGSINLADKLDNLPIDNNVLTNIKNTEYLIKILSPNLIVTSDDNFIINFNIYENAFDNNDLLTVALHTDKFTTTRTFIVAENVIYDKNQLTYSLSNKTSIFNILSTGIDNGYYLMIKSTNKILTSDPTKYIYICNNQNNQELVFKINQNNLSYNTTQNSELLIKYFVNGLRKNSIFSLSINGLCQYESIQYTKPGLYYQTIEIPEYAENKNYNIQLNHENGFIMDLVSEIKVNTCKLSNNIIPNYGYNGHSFNQDNCNNTYKNTIQNLSLPLHINSVELSIIHDNILYSGNLKVKSGSVVSFETGENTLLSVNNLNIFSNRLLFNALGNMSIVKNVNKSNEINIVYNANDSYIINLKDINLYHVNNNNILIDKYLHVYTSYNSDGMNLEFYKTLAVQEDKNGKYLILGTNKFNFSGELHFYIKNSLLSTNAYYIGSINITDILPDCVYDDN